MMEEEALSAEAPGQGQEGGFHMDKPQAVKAPLPDPILLPEMVGSREIAQNV